MPFQFQPVTNRYATTIAELLGVAPRAQAEAAMTAANAKARALEFRGAARANQIGNLSSTIGDLLAMPRQLAQQRQQDARLAQANQLQGLQIQEAQGNLADAATARTEKTKAQQAKELTDYGYLLFKSGHLPEMAQRVIAHGVQKGWLSPEEAQQLSSPEAITAKGTEFLGMTDHGRQLLEETVTNKPGDVVTNKLTGAEVLHVPPTPPPPGAGQHVINGQLVGPDGKPIGNVIPPQVNPTQAASQTETARHNAEMERIAKMTVGRQAMAQAETARHDLAMEGAKNAPLDIGPDIQTTVSGKTYVDGSLYSTGERDRARKAANDAGAVFVSKEQANALQEIDNARANQSSIMNQIGDLLPKGPAGRPVAAAGVLLSKVFQSDEQKAAFASWRTAAIQTLRATAGSKGLRINQAEIAQAIENDIPKLTDTLGTAQQKMKNINTMLDNAERSIVVRDRGVTTPPPSSSPLTPGLQGLKDRP